MGFKILISTILSSGYKILGAFFIYGKVFVQVSYKLLRNCLDFSIW